MSLLEVSVSAGHACSVVTLAGEADVNDAAELSEVLSAQISGGTRHLTVDLSQLRFADSTAIRMLIVAGQSLGRVGGELELRRPQPAVMRVFELLALDQMFTITDCPGPGDVA